MPSLEPATGAIPTRRAASAALTAPCIPRKPERTVKAAGFAGLFRRADDVGAHLSGGDLTAQEDPGRPARAVADLDLAEPGAVEAGIGIQADGALAALHHQPRQVFD